MLLSWPFYFFSSGQQVLECVTVSAGSGMPEYHHQISYICLGANTSPEASDKEITGWGFFMRAHLQYCSKRSAQKKSDYYDNYVDFVCCTERSLTQSTHFLHSQIFLLTICVWISQEHDISTFIICPYSCCLSSGH